MIAEVLDGDKGNALAIRRQRWAATQTLILPSLLEILEIQLSIGIDAGPAVSPVHRLQKLVCPIIGEQ